MRVLVTGANGQLGREVVEAFASTAFGHAAGTAFGHAAGHEVVATDQETLDLGSRDSVFAGVTTVEPDAVVHAAAWTDVDGCEADPDRALRVNALGTRHLVAAARLVGARVCYISTDYVFDGLAGRPYDEWDTPQPVSVYGRSKRGGELELGPEDTTVRTSWLCGRHGGNFVRTVLTRAAAGQELRVVDDQHGCLTHAGDLAAMIRRLVVERRAGVFHVTNQGPTTWFRLARDAVAAAGFDVELVRPIGTVELQPPRPAPRPPYAVLDNAALRLAGLPLLPEHHDALARLVPDLVPATTVPTS